MSTGLTIKNINAVSSNILEDLYGVDSKRVGKMTFLHGEDGWTKVIVYIDGEETECQFASDNDLDEVLDWISNELEN